jgi:hypothetical protein
LLNIGEALETPDVNDPIISIDMEWAPGQYGINTGGDVSVVQFVCNALVYFIVIHLSTIRNPKRVIDEILIPIFGRDDALFVGCCINKDWTKMKKDYSNCQIQVLNVMDLGAITVNRGVNEYKRGETTLNFMYHKSTGKHLHKPQNVR